MELKDLRNGMIIETRDGAYYLVLDNKKEESFRLLDKDTGEKVAFNLANGNYLDLDEYEANLTDLSLARFDIINIYTLDYFGELFRDNFKEHLTCIWKREETKEMTVEEKEITIKELEKELGDKMDKGKKLPEIHVDMILQLDNKYDCIIICDFDAYGNKYKAIVLKDGEVYDAYNCLEDIRKDATKYYSLAELILEEI